MSDRLDDLKRYHFWIDATVDNESGMEEEANGSYVLYSDAKAILAAKDAEIVEKDKQIREYYISLDREAQRRVELAVLKDAEIAKWIRVAGENQRSANLCDAKVQELELVRDQLSQALSCHHHINLALTRQLEEAKHTISHLKQGLEECGIDSSAVECGECIYKIMLVDQEKENAALTNRVSFLAEIERQRDAEICDNHQVIEHLKEKVRELEERLYNNAGIHDEEKADLTRQLEEMKETLKISEKSEDSLCVESDGCPTENARLRREWRSLTRQLEPIREVWEKYKKKNVGDMFSGELWNAIKKAVGKEEKLEREMEEYGPETAGDK